MLTTCSTLVTNIEKYTENNNNEKNTLIDGIFNYNSNVTYNNSTMRKPSDNRSQEQFQWQMSGVFPTAGLGNIPTTKISMPSTS